MLTLDELTSEDITRLLNAPKKKRPRTGSFVIHRSGEKEYRTTPGWLVGSYTTPDRYKAPRSISGKARNNPHYLLETDVVAYSTKRS